MDGQWSALNDAVTISFENTKPSKFVLKAIDHKTDSLFEIWPSIGNCRANVRLVGDVFEIDIRFQLIDGTLIDTDGALGVGRDFFQALQQAYKLAIKALRSYHQEQSEGNKIKRVLQLCDSVRGGDSFRRMDPRKKKEFIQCYDSL